VNSNHYVKIYKFKFFLYKTNFKIKDYQSGWTLVGGGIKTADQVRKPQQDLIPAGVDWIKCTYFNIY
jgi:hypothetical protein